jgi:membrane-associated phospholipid phosphatase
MNRVLEADRYVFSLINYKWQNSFFDWLLPFFRNSVFWIPLYLFLFVFALANIRKPYWFILLAAATAGLTDMVSSHMVKEWVMRVRPCHEVSLMGQIRVLAIYCPQSSSFTSSHAANHFGLATFLVISLREVAGRWIYLAFAWAFFIVYAQIYVGVHYPTDIIGGAMIGVLAGLLTGGIYKRIMRNFEQDNLRN